MFNATNKQRGFTLGELVTTVAIAGLALSLAVPSFNTIVNNSRRATGINQLVATMHTARSEAITRGTRVMLCPSTDGNACSAVAWNEGWLAFIDTNNNQALDGGEAIISTVDEQTRLDVISAEFAAGISYRPNGRAMAANVATNTGEFTVCDPRGASHARVVILDASGHPRLSKTATGGGAPACP
ncbi:MAG: GspH/FimT family pseudopilin [Gammaproteobacteria bacterium]|nr:GspH/FimT family pseudopilin [Gammaproteobacteria bacterium]